MDVGQRCVSQVTLSKVSRRKMTQTKSQRVFAEKPLLKGVIMVKHSVKSPSRKTYGKGPFLGQVDVVRSINYHFSLK